MISFQAVVEVEPLDDSPVPWPVAPADAWSWLILNAGCTSEQVGLFVAVLASRIETPASAGPEQVMDALAAEEVLIVNGGLLVTDPGTGVEVVPNTTSASRSPRCRATFSAFNDS